MWLQVCCFSRWKAGLLRDTRTWNPPRGSPKWFSRISTELVVILLWQSQQNTISGKYGHCPSLDLHSSPAWCWKKTSTRAEQNISMFVTSKVGCPYQLPDVVESTCHVYVTWRQARSIGFRLGHQPSVVLNCSHDKRPLVSLASSKERKTKSAERRCPISVGQIQVDPKGFFSSQGSW